MANVLALLPPFLPSSLPVLSGKRYRVRNEFTILIWRAALAIYYLRGGGGGGGGGGCGAVLLLVAS